MVLLLLLAGRFYEEHGSLKIEASPVWKQTALVLRGS